MIFIANNLHWSLLCDDPFKPLLPPSPPSSPSLPPSSKQQKEKKAAKISEISDPILLDRYIAIADYDKVKKNECNLKAGQTVEVIDKNQNGERQFTRVCCALHFSIPQYITVYHSISQYTTVHHSIPQYITVHHTMSQYITLCHSILQCIIVYSKTSPIRVAWDQGVSVTKKMPITEKYVYCV